MKAQRINSLACLLFGAVIIFSTVSCKSRKGEHVQIFAEAKQIQTSLEKSGKINKEELQKQIDRVETDKIRRWKISTKKSILIESIKSYRDYRNPSEKIKFIYSINDDLDIVLK